MNKQAFHNLRIQSIEKETEGSSRIRFALPETLVDEFNFKPGQYISIKFEMKKIASNGKKFYNKHFNSTLVSQFILDRTFKFKNKFTYSWYKKN